MDLTVEIGNAAKSELGVWEVGPDISAPVLIAEPNGWVGCAMGERCIVALDPKMDQGQHYLTVSMRDADGRPIGGEARKDFAAGPGQTSFVYNFYQAEARLTPGTYFVMVTLDGFLRRERTIVVVRHGIFKG